MKKDDLEMVLPKKPDSLLEQTVSLAWHGTPELHPEQKRKYLGTFEERVLAYLTEKEFAANPETIKPAIREALDDAKSAIVLIRADHIELLVDYLNLARQKGLSFRSVSRPDLISDIVLVVATAKTDALG